MRERAYCMRQASAYGKIDGEVCREKEHLLLSIRIEDPRILFELEETAS